ncbi:MAG: esterase/lipase family protein [Eubacteriaceae bacterium]
MKNYPIIVIPGVFDSCLYFDAALTKLAWPIKSIAKVMDIARHDNLKELEVEYSVPMFVKEPTNNTTAQIPDYGSNDTWKDMTQGLIDAFPGRDVWFFPYDFRQLSSVSMIRFAEFLDSFDSPVDVVCHSYGNNLLAAYVSRYGGDKIHRGACLAPPFEGSPEIFLVPPQSINFPCMGELAPSPTINKIYPTRLKKEEHAEANPASLREYDEILVKFFGSGWIPVDFSGIINHPGIHFGAGADRLTTLGTTFTYNDEGLPYVTDFQIGHAGDTTVPIISASMDGKLMDKLTLFPGVAHTEFAENKTVLYWTIMQINSNDPPMIPPRIDKAPYVKFLIEGSIDVHVRKPFSVLDFISPTESSTVGAESLLIGSDRNLELLVLNPQECVVEIYSIRKRTDFKVTIMHYDADEKLVSTRVENVSGRFVRFTMREDGTIEEPFVLDIPPLLGSEGAIKIPTIPVISALTSDKKDEKEPEIRGVGVSERVPVHNSGNDSDKNSGK